MHVSTCAIVLITLLVCAAIAGVGVGVYFGTRGTYCPKVSDPSASSIPTVVPETSTAATKGPASSTVSPILEEWRLPTSILPTLYTLRVQPYIPSPSVQYDAAKNLTFDGSVTIELNVVKCTENVTMHMNRIEVKKFEIFRRSATGPVLISEDKFSYSQATQLVAFSATSQLCPGANYFITIKYTGILAGDLGGFYSTHYIERGETKWMAMTQMEPTDARRALPCFDEPSFKAKFDMEIIHPAEMVALSNARESSSIALGGGWNRTTFETSPLMSSYLLAFVVADFDKIEVVSNTSQKTLFRVWCRPSLLDKTRFASEAGPKVLEYYETYFKIDFPLGKQDMVAVPEFSAGAMENWGLVTYRESFLLYDNVNYAAEDKHSVGGVIAHELAHQWFGDYVTMAWWDDIWLNEGFAQNLMDYGEEEINPAFHARQRFVATTRAESLGADQLASSHPIHVPILTPTDMRGIFDGITYSKTASVLEMLRNVLGENVYRDGLTIYLTKHQYANANNLDLWAALQEAVNNLTSPVGWEPPNLINVTQFMNTWTLQKNFPVVRVHRTDASSFQLSQSRFQLYPEAANATDPYPSPFNYTWFIPIWYSEAGSKLNVSKLAWMKRNEGLTLRTTLPNQILLVNDGAKGFYRVLYDDELWDAIASFLVKNMTTTVDQTRSQILDDALNFAQAGLISYPRALQMTCYVSQETSVIPLLTFFEGLVYVQNMFLYTNMYKPFQGYMRRVSEELYQKLNPWNDDVVAEDDVLQHDLNRGLLKFSCEFEVTDCRSQSLARFNNFLSKCSNASSSSSCASNPINANLRNVVYCNGVAQGTTTQWEQMWHLYTVESVSSEKLALLRALTCTREPWLIQRLILESIDGTYIRPMDVGRTFYPALSQNAIARMMLWPFFVNNFEVLIEQLGDVWFALQPIVTVATSSFNTEAQVKDLEAFIAAHRLELGPLISTFEQQLETAKTNVRWMERYAKTVTAWFTANQGGCKDMRF